MFARTLAGLLLIVVGPIAAAAQTPQGAAPGVSPTAVRLSTIPDGIDVSDSINSGAPTSGTVVRTAALEKVLRDAGFDPGPDDIKKADNGEFEFSIETQDGRVVVRTGASVIEGRIEIRFWKYFEPRRGVNGFGPRVRIGFNPKAERPVVAPDPPSVLDQIDNSPSPAPLSTIGDIRLGGFGGGAGIDNTRLSFTRNLEVVTGRINGIPIQERNTELPADQTISLQVMNASAPRISLPLGSRHDGSGESTFVHNFVAAVAAAPADLEFRNGVDATTWQGNGFQWSGEYGAIVRACDGCPFFITGSIGHTRIRIKRMKTEPIDLGGLFTGQPEADFVSRVTTAGVGITIRRSLASISAGIGVQKRSASLTGSALVSGDSVTPASLNLSFENDLGDTHLNATLGTEIFLGERYRLQVQGATGGRDMNSLAAAIKRLF